MCGVQQDLRGHVGVERLLPARGAKAPPIAGLQTGKFELRARGREVVSLRKGKRQEFLSHDRADGVDTEVAGAGMAKSVPVEPGEGVVAAGFKFASENISSHRKNLSADCTSGEFE